MKRALFLMLMTLVLAIPALAQDPASPERPSEPGDVTGTISGEIDGEEFILHTFLVEAGLPEPTNTAYWGDRRGMGLGISVDVSAHREAGVMPSVWRGAISLDLDLNDDLEYLDHGNVPDISYFESLTNGYRMSEGSLELTEAAWVDEETLRLAGNFAGTFSSIMGEADKQILAQFSFEWVSVQQPDF